MVFDLLYAADYLDIASLLDASSKAASMIDPVQCKEAVRVMSIKQLADLVSLEKHNQAMRAQILKNNGEHILRIFDDLIGKGVIDEDRNVVTDAYKSEGRSRTIQRSSTKARASLDRENLLLQNTMDWTGSIPLAVWLGVETDAWMR